MKKKIVWFILIFIFSIGFIFLFLLYGPYSSFRDFLITTSMTTMNHRYIAKMFYSEKTIYKVLDKNKIEETDEVTDKSLYKFGEHTVIKSSYDRKILNRKKDDLYKIININGKGYRGFLVAIYDPSLVTLGISKYLGKKGEKITTVSKRKKAVVAINAGGFYDPLWKSNGGLVHGAVIKNGKIITDYKNAVNVGGFIGFNKDNELILGKFSNSDALKQNYRDAIEFGPFLIINGKNVKVKGNGGWGIAPRTAIGQRRDGIVLFLVINGRIPSSIGASMKDLIEILQNYGAINAANLDGGSSTELYVNKKVINTPVGGGEDGLRLMPVYWIVKKD